MDDERKTKHQLIRELTELRRRISEFESPTADFRQISGELRRALAQQSLVGVTIFQDGQVVYANEAAANISGYSVEELQEKGFDAIAKLTYPEDAAFVREQTEKRLQGKEGAIPRYSRRIVTKSGETKWIEVFSQPITYQARPASWSVITDVTEEKRTEEALKRSEERFRVMFDNAHDLMTIADLEANTIWANAAWCKTLGYTQETQGDPFDKVHPDDREAAAAAWEAFLKGGELSDFEYRYKTAGGGYVVLETTAHVLRAAGGPFVSVIAHDITRRKRTEEALRGSEERFHNLMDHIPGVSIQGYELDGTVVYWNKASEKVYGYSAEEALGKNLADLIIPADLKPLFNKCLELGRATKASGEFMPPGELTLLHKDGHPVPVYSIHTAVCLEGQPPLLFCIDVDLTVRRRAEEELRESKTRYWELAESLPATVCQVDETGGILYANQTAFNAFGYTREEFDKGLNVLQMIAPEDRARAGENIRRVLGGQRLGGVEYTAQRKDGTTFPVIIRSEPVIRGNRPVGFLGIVVDITERKRVEEALRESEQKYRTLFESAPEAILLLDLNGKILDCNKATTELLGMPKKTIVGRHLDKLVTFDEDNFSRAFDLLAQVRCGEKVSPTALKLTTHGKDLRWIEVYPSLVSIGDERMAVQVIACDITEQRKMEEELIRAQKLESLGILAGGIAHDFNNLLGAVLANVSLAQKHIQPDTKAHKPLEEARKALARARDLGQRLLAFSKGGTPVKKLVSLEQIASEAANVALRGSRVRCEIVIAPELCPVEADEGQLYQVVNNIITNAVQAMPDGGTVSLHAENLPAAQRRPLPLPDCDCVKLSISDDGPGIREEHIPKIFDPYFTTKQQGMGLGLAAAHAIVARHRGHIRVDSELNVGTTFHIYLPASRRPAFESAGAVDKVSHSGGRILVVDDEEIMLKAADAVLRDLGYDVDLARNGEEAVKVTRGAMDSGSPIDLVIMDLTIPHGVGGKEAVSRLREIDPNLKAIASSGYSDDPVLAGQGDHCFQGVLRKPYDVEDMANIVSQVLKEAGGD